MLCDERGCKSQKPLRAKILIPLNCCISWNRTVSRTCSKVRGRASSWKVHGRESLYGKLNILEKANMFNDDLQPRQYTISSKWARKSRPSIVDKGAEARQIGSSRHKLLRYRGAMMGQWGTAKRRTYRLGPRNSGSGAPLQDGQQARATHEAEHVKIMRTIGRFEATQSAPGMSDRVSRGANT